MGHLDKNGRWVVDDPQASPFKRGRAQRMADGAAYVRATTDKTPDTGRSRMTDYKGADRVRSAAVKMAELANGNPDNAHKLSRWLAGEREGLAGLGVDTKNPMVNAELIEDFATELDARTYQAEQDATQRRFETFVETLFGDHYQAADWLAHQDNQDLALQDLVDAFSAHEAGYDAPDEGPGWLERYAEQGRHHRADVDGEYITDFHGGEGFGDGDAGGYEGE